MIGEKANPKSERFLDSPRNDKGPMMTWMRKRLTKACGRKAEAGMTFKDYFSKQAADYAIFRPFTWEASRQVVSSRGIAPRETDKRQLDWQRCSTA